MSSLAPVPGRRRTSLDSESPVSLLKLDISGFRLKLENVVCSEKEKQREKEGGRGGEGQLGRKTSSFAPSS